MHSLEEDDKKLEGENEPHRLIEKHELAYLKNNINELLACDDKGGEGSRGSFSKLFTQSFKVKMSDSEDLAKAFVASEAMALVSESTVESELNHQGQLGLSARVHR